MEIRKKMFGSRMGVFRRKICKSFRRKNKFKTLAENCGFKYGDNSVKAFASISKDFLDRHADLL